VGWLVNSFLTKEYNGRYDSLCGPVCRFSRATTVILSLRLKQRKVDSSGMSNCKELPSLVNVAF